MKKAAPALLALAAFAVILATVFSDHRADHGSVQLPEGGTVVLPEGSVKVFAEEGDSEQEAHELSQPLVFRVTPAAGGPIVPLAATAKQGTSEAQRERSTDIAEHGSVAELEVPAAGTYVVGGTFGGSRVTLTFGDDPISAVVERWRLWGGLLGASVLLSLIPVPGPRGSSSGRMQPGPPASSASPPPAQPHAAPPSFKPYDG